VIGCGLLVSRQLRDEIGNCRRQPTAPVFDYGLTIAPFSRIVCKTPSIQVTRSGLRGKIRPRLHRSRLRVAASRVFQQDPEMFRVLVYMPKLKEGDTTSDPRTWCNGFVEDGVQSRKLGADLCDEVFREDRTDPNDFRSGRMGKKGCLNPFTELIPLELCDGLKIAALAIHAFWSSYDPNRGGFRHRWPLTPQSQLFKFAPEPELTENRVRTVILGHAA
jgi:hypothetical protein